MESQEPGPNLIRLRLATRLPYDVGAHSMQLGLCPVCFLPSKAYDEASDFRPVVGIDHKGIIVHDAWRRFGAFV